MSPHLTPTLRVIENGTDLPALSLSRAKSVYSRKGVEPFQVTMLLAVLATDF